MLEYEYFDGGQFVVSKKVAPTVEQALDIYYKESGDKNMNADNVHEDYVRFYHNCPDSDYDSGCYQLGESKGKGSLPVWVIE